MDNSEFKKIKNKYGEKMAKLCRDSFAGIKGVYEFLIENFEPSYYLYEDLAEIDLINETSLINKFKSYVYSELMSEKKQTVFKDVEAPEVLMEKAGYILRECYTEEEIQEYKKYYAPGEILCTFRSGRRLDKCRVFFAVKKNVNEIKREDFSLPQREDEYGTSVISIQFERNETNMLSIKNRYNHSVTDADATFSNNLDNIIPGLTASFEQHYGLKQRILQGDLDIPNYVRDGNGKFYRYNYEINRVYFCPNNIIIENSVAQRLEPEKYILMDYFILDLVAKKVKLISGIGRTDNFVRELTNIAKITITNNNMSKVVTIVRNDGATIVIELDKYNRIIGYSNDRAISVDRFLEHNTVLQKVDMPALEDIGASAFYRKSLKSFTIPNSVQSIGDYAFYHNQLTEAIIPSGVKYIGTCAFEQNKLEKVIIPDGVRSIRKGAFGHNRLTKITIPNGVQSIEAEAFCMNKLAEAKIPDGVETIGKDAFFGNQLTEVVIPNSVQSIGTRAFEGNKLKRITIPGSITAIESRAFSINELVEVTLLDGVRYIGASAFEKNNLKKVIIPNSVQTIENRAFYTNQLTSVDIPSSTVDVASYAFDDQTKLVYKKNKNQKN